MKIEITRVKKHWFPGEAKDVVGEYDALVEGFCIRRGTIWRSQMTGDVYATTPGRDGDRGITCQPGPLRDELCAAAVAAWRDLR